MMDNKWKLKYLKYKSKYLQLKQTGGVISPYIAISDVFLLLEDSEQTVGNSPTRGYKYNLNYISFLINEQIIEFNKNFIRNSVNYDIFNDNDIFYLSLGKNFIYYIAGRFYVKITNPIPNPPPVIDPDLPDQRGWVMMGDEYYYYFDVDFSSKLKLYCDNLKIYLSSYHIHTNYDRVGKILDNSLYRVNKSLNSTYNLLIMYKIWINVQCSFLTYTFLQKDTIDNIVYPFISLRTFIINKVYDKKIDFLKLFYETNETKYNISLYSSKKQPKRVSFYPSSDFGVKDSFFIFNPSAEIIKEIEDVTGDLLFLNDLYPKIYNGTERDIANDPILKKVTTEAIRLNRFIDNFNKIFTKEGVCTFNKGYLLKLNNSSTGIGITTLSHCDDKEKRLRSIAEYLINKVYRLRDDIKQNKIKIKSTNEKNLNNENNNFFIQTLYESPFNIFESEGTLSHRVRCKLRFFWSPIIYMNVYESNTSKFYGSMIYMEPDFEFYLANREISNYRDQAPNISVANKDFIKREFVRYINTEQGKTLMYEYSKILSNTIDKTFFNMDKIMCLFMINGLDAMMIGRNNTITGISILESNSGPVFISDDTIAPTRMYHSYVDTVHKVCTLIKEKGISTKDDDNRQNNTTFYEINLNNWIGCFKIVNPT